MYYAYLPNKVKSAKMLAILQSAGTVPDERLIIDEGQDYRKSLAVSLRTRGESSSGPVDFLGLSLERSLKAPGTVTVNTDFRTIFGIKAHASAEAIHVISNVTPVRLRLQHMCTLEYARIMQKADNNRLRNMLDGSILIGNTFSPMSYIKHQAKLLHLNSENITIASEHITTISEILEDVKLSQIDVAGEDGAAYTKPDDRVDS